MEIFIWLLTWLGGMALVGFIITIVIGTYLGRKRKKELERLIMFEGLGVSEFFDRFDKDDEEGIEKAIQEYWVAKNQFNNADQDNVDEAIRRLNLAEMKLDREYRTKKQAGGE